MIESEVVAPCVWRWRQHGPPKLWYPTTTLHGVTTQKTWNWISPPCKPYTLQKGD